MREFILRQKSNLLSGFFLICCGAISPAEEPEPPPLSISVQNRTPHLQWFGEYPDNYYSLKATSDLSSGDWRNVMTGRLGRGELHEWIDTEELSAVRRFYQLVPYTDLTGKTSDSGVFSFQLEDAEKQVFVTDSDNRPLAGMSVQVQVDSDTFLVQVHDTSGGYFPTMETIGSEQARLDVTLRERQLTSDGETPAWSSSADAVHLLSQKDDYGFIPPDAQVEVLRGAEAEEMLDVLANLREPTWKTYARGGVRVGKEIETIHTATQVIKTGTLANPVLFVITWGTFASLDEMLKPELEKWFTRVNHEHGMVLMQSDETITSHGNIAGTVTTERGGPVSDYSVFIDDLPVASHLTKPGAYVVGSIPCSPGGTTYSVTVEPESGLSLSAPSVRTRRASPGKEIVLSAWVSDLSPAAFDVTVKPGTTARGCVEISGMVRDDLTPVIKYRPIESSDDWTSVPMSSGNGFDQYTFTGSVPGSAMTEPGLEVYIGVSDGEDIARTPVAQYVPAASFIAIDSNPSGAQVLVNGEPAGETVLSLPVEKDETLNLTAHIPDSSFPVLERTVTDTEPEDRLVMFDFVGERQISVTAPTAETLEGGSTTEITWETEGDVPYVEVLYRSGDSSRWRRIADAEPNEGSIEWQVPNWDMTDVQVKVRSSDDYRFQMVSPAFNVVWKSPPPPAPEGMVSIPAGSFEMGDRFNEGRDRELPVHTVHISAFHMDRYPVTKKLWDEVYEWAIHPDRGDDVYFFDNSGSDQASGHPVYEVSWYDVVKWCNARSEMEGLTPAYYTSSEKTAENIYRTGRVDVENDWVRWDSGYRLPTEAEREYAARGGLEGRRFPWGDTIDHDKANYRSRANTYDYDDGPGEWKYHPKALETGSKPYTTPVDYFEPNDYGLYDMIGNLWEWTWDWYNEDEYDRGTVTNPRGPSQGLWRVFRGGSWSSSSYSCRVTARNSYGPNQAIRGIGFRAVLPPGSASAP